jgi:hypothetical protein
MANQSRTPPSGPSGQSSEDKREDLRREPRTTAKRALEVIPCQAKTGPWGFVGAELVDCSPNGIAILVRQEFRPGESFLVKLAVDNARLVLYRVQHCVPSLVRGCWRVGGELLGAIAADGTMSPECIFGALLSTAIKSAGEQRAA